MRQRPSVMDRYDPTLRPDQAFLNEDARAERGPAAIAASILVMAAGAGFLALTMATEPPVALRAPGTLQAESRASLPPAPDQTAAAPSPVIIAAAAPSDPLPLEGGATEAAEKDGAITPRLKPAIANAGPETGPEGVLARPKAIILGEHRRAGANDGPPPFFFAADLAPRRTLGAPLAIALSRDIDQPPLETIVRLSSGENFIDALKRAGVGANDRNQAAYAFGKYYNLRGLLPGQEFRLTTSLPNQTLFQLAAAGTRAPEARLLALEFRSDAEHRIYLKRGRDGAFSAEKSAVTLISRQLAFSGRIDGSLYLSAKKAGAPDPVIAALADIFAYDVDFQREIFGGDEFEAIFEARYDDAGELVAIGDILYGRLKWRGRTKEKGYYRFAASDRGGRADYYDASGQSAKRLLMKTPIDGARLSSGFGTRKHPILGYAKAHKGVDFAARRGTPIKAAGDGTIERAGPYSSFGNYIRIRHANGYKTAYAHLNSIRKGVRAGRRVNQGQIIGYVGTTGRSTGPHLHYEVHLNGKAVNPQRLKIATGRKLKGAEMTAFEAVRDRIDAMRLPPADDAQLLAKDDTSGSSL